MAQLTRDDASEETFPVAPIHGTIQCDPEVRKAVMATTTVESPGDSASPQWEIAGMLFHDDHAKEGEQITGSPMCIVYAHQVNSELCWSLMLPDGALWHLRSVSVPSNVRELCEGCFRGLKRLRRVTFGASSCIERISSSCFERSGVEEVSIPNSVRELCDHCFFGCESLRRIIFGSSSSLEVIGVGCFGDSGLEEVIIPDSVRKLDDGCFEFCRRLRRVIFGCSSSLECIGVHCFVCSGIEEVVIPDSVRQLCDGCFESCTSLRRVTFSSSSPLDWISSRCFEGTEAQFFGRTERH